MGNLKLISRHVKYFQQGAILKGLSVLSVLVKPVKQKYLDKLIMINNIDQYDLAARS